MAKGKELIEQRFTGAQYFQSRPPPRGVGYDASVSGGSNLGPTNQKLIDRIPGDVKSLSSEHDGQTVPIDPVSTSGSWLDPDITPVLFA